MYGSLVQCLLFNLSSIPQYTFTFGWHSSYTSGRLLYKINTKGCDKKVQSTALNKSNVSAVMESGKTFCEFFANQTNFLKLMSTQKEKEK